MKSHIIVFLLWLMSPLCMHAQLTIEQCVENAMANYPAVKKYRLMSVTKEIELSDINKSWLPRIGVYGQATVQNMVPTFPETLEEILDKMGQETKGLGKSQYKVGIDITQTIWDGGVSAAQREAVRSQEAVREASVDVEHYKIRQRVENIFFAILLTEKQIDQSRITYGLLDENLSRLRSMLINGTAMQADVDMAEAQSLELNQSITQALSTLRGYRKTLSLFIGKDISADTLVQPSLQMPSSYESNRPELRLFDRQLDATRSAENIANTATMPKIGIFAQAYYGYPGFNYFQSMMNRDLSFNILAGIKVSWNLDSFYTKKNTRRRTAIDTENISVEREIFLFNSNISATSQTEAIDGLREIMKDDEQIIELRANVRKAAESQLKNGVIDITALLSKISDENIARLTARYHEIQLLQDIYKLKYTLDR